MDIYTVYFNPSDWPGKYVVRKHVVPTGPTDVCYVSDTLEGVRAYSDTLEGVRAYIPLGFIKFDRHRDDPLVVVEIWL